MAQSYLLILTGPLFLALFLWRLLSLPGNLSAYSLGLSLATLVVVVPLLWEIVWEGFRWLRVGFLVVPFLIHAALVLGIKEREVQYLDDVSPVDFQQIVLLASADLLLLFIWLIIASHPAPHRNLPDRLSGPLRRLYLAACSITAIVLVFLIVRILQLRPMEMGVWSAVNQALNEVRIGVFAIAIVSVTKFILPGSIDFLLRQKSTDLRRDG